VSAGFIEMARLLRLEVAAQLALAAVLGGALGLERELKGKPAGLRTNTLICMGATLFTILSSRLAPPGGDVGRVAAQVVTGIGFLGAGTIIHASGTVTGLTSAATIWLVAAVGMAVGCRAYLVALGATALAMVVLEGLRSVENVLAKHVSRMHLFVRARQEPGVVTSVEQHLRNGGLFVEACHVRREGEDVLLEVDVRGPRRAQDAARLALLDHPGVRSVSTSGPA
jgi:putative Mg2+ transporter-C (MgtC) family protein